MKANYQYIIGIDEAGCGPLAGPLVVAGVCVQSSHAYIRKIKREKKETRKTILENLSIFGVADSKKLSEKKREELFLAITSHPNISWATSTVSHSTIDQINVRNAAHIGTRRVYKKLAFQKTAHAFLDGSLMLPRTVSYDVIIKGDQRVSVISAASIIAKVVRDRIMRRLHKKFPRYGFDAHKGYGTKRHRELLKIHGISAIHRLSFCRRIQNENYSN